jgi:polar amino acid transport system permease protein
MRDFTVFDMVLLAQAARWTVLLSLITFVGGGLLGGLITIMRISRIGALRQIAVGWITLLQGTPLLMQIFLCYFGLGLAGIDLPPIVAATIAFVAYASAFFAEIWRGAVEAIPRPQWEGSASLGLSRLEQLRYVIVPQAMRMALPPTVGFAVQIIKNTSLASLIGFVDLARAGQLINNVTVQPFPVFGTVAAIYFILCYPLSLASRFFERRLHVGRARLARR